MDKAIKTEAVNGEAPAEETSSASDEELAAAYALETAEETEDQETPTEETEEEPEEAKEPEPDEEPDAELPHPESSRLGRKVKRLDDNLKERDREIEVLKAELNQLKGVLLVKTSDEEETLDPDDVATVGSVEKIISRKLEELEKKSDEKRQKEVEYQNKYENFLADRADDDPDIFDEIVELLSGETEFNRIHTGDPKIDIEINYNKAKAHLLSQEKEKSKPKLKGERAKGTKVGDTDKAKTKSEKSIDLSTLGPAEKEFLEGVKRRGGDPQALVNKALGEKG